MSTPGGVNPQAPADSLNALKDAEATMLETAKLLVDAMKEISPTVEKATKSFKEANKEVEGMYDSSQKWVNKMGGWADGVDRLYRTYKTLGRTVKDGNLTHRQLLDIMTKLVAESERAAKSGFLSGKSQRVAYEATDNLKKKVLELTKAAHKVGLGEMVDESTLRAQASLIEDMTNRVTEFSDAWKGVNLHPLTKQIRGINELLGLQGKHVEKLARWGHRAVEFRQNHADEKKAREERNTDRSTRLRQALVDSGADITYKRGKNKGMINPDKLETVLKSGGAGLGAESRGIVGSLNRLTGNKWADKVYQRGEGSGLTGVLGHIGDKVMGSEGGGVAGLMGTMGKFAGPLGIAMSVGELLKDAYDKSRQMNIEVEKGIGGAGIFSGKETGAEAFSNIRKNLTPGYWSDNNVTYEKQLNVAKAMHESGLGLADLSMAGGGNKGFNQVSKVAFGSARLAGLDESAATKEIIKLLEVYHMSLNSTDSFFQKLSKDTRAAGISTTKYLSILDEITGQFDSMGKSIDGVTTLMRALGRTGLQSADSMKKSMDALIGAKSRPIAEQAFVGQQYLDNPESLKAVISTLGGTFTKSIDVVRNTVQALEGSDESYKGMSKGLDLTTPEGLNALAMKFGRLQGDKPANVLTHNLGDAIKQALIDSNNLDMHQKLQANGNLVQYGASRQMTPTNPMLQALDNSAIIKFIAQKSEVREEDLLNDPHKMNSAAAPLMSLLMEKFHVTQDQVASISPAFHGGVSTFVNEATKARGENEYDPVTNEQYKKLAAIAEHEAKIKREKGLDDKSFVKSIKGEDIDKLMGAVSKTADAFQLVMKEVQEVMAKEVAKGETKKQMEVAEQTKLAADIFANAFQHMFNWISDAINLFSRPLLDFLHARGAKDDTAGEGAVNEYKTYANDEYVGKGIGFLTNQIKQLNEDKNTESNKSAPDKKLLSTYDEAIANSNFALKQLTEGRDLANRGSVMTNTEIRDNHKKLSEGREFVNTQLTNTTSIPGTVFDLQQKANREQNATAAAQQQGAATAAADDQAKTDKTAPSGTASSGATTKTPDQPKGPVTYNQWGAVFHNNPHDYFGQSSKPAEGASVGTQTSDYTPAGIPKSPLGGLL